MKKYPLVALGYLGVLLLLFTILTLSYFHNHNITYQSVRATVIRKENNTIMLQYENLTLLEKNLKIYNLLETGDRVNAKVATYIDSDGKILKTQLQLN